MSAVNIEAKLREADFSKETDLKDRLREKLFGKGGGILSFPAEAARNELTESELSEISAAGISAQGNIPRIKTGPGGAESR